jgi:organic radical activating enzyme
MKVNEIFYSIQGEGFFAGTPAIFVRFAGCNLKCPFCDTNHQTYKEYTEDEICDSVASYKANLVVLTGGEPTLQVTESLIKKLHELGKFVAIETNGTKQVPRNIDWITLSPKDMYVNKANIVLTYADELKVVYDGKHNIPNYNVQVNDYYIQPCDVGNTEENNIITNKCIEFIKDNPRWKISIQLQKILKVQ